MPFPTTPVGVKVELDLVGDWSAPVEISSKVYSRDPFTVTRGRSAEAGTADPSTATFTLNNRDGRFSPRNPLGPYFGQLGRNTPVRISVPGGSVRAATTPGAAANYRAADSAGTSVTGDIDIRLDLDPPSWRFPSGLARPLAYKYSGTTQRSWYLELGNDGRLRLFWSADGAVNLSSQSTVPVPFPVAGRRAVRVTLDVDNGASGNTVTFYTAATIGGAWTQLGDPVVKAGTTAIFDSTSSTFVHLNDGNQILPVELYAAEVRNGIGGTVVASPTFTAQPDGAGTFADAQGNSWIPSDARVSVTSRRYRFYGEVSAWPQSWDSTGRDVVAQVTAAGVLRRLGQGAGVLRSPLFRGVTRSAVNLVAYWPMEDDASAISVASGIGGMAMRFTGAPSLAAYDDFAASEPIPTGGVFTAQLPVYALTGTTQIRFLMNVPVGGVANGAVLARISTTGGTTARWDLIYGTGGTMTLTAYSPDGAVLGSVGPVGFAVDGRRVQVSIELVESGGAVNYRVSTINDDGTGSGYYVGSLSSNTVARVTSVVLNVSAQSTLSVGHLYAQTVQTNAADLGPQLNAYNGETAGARIIRLAGEEGLACTVLGDPADTQAMGRQGTLATLLGLLREAADTDQGVLLEPRDYFGLAFRTRNALLNQPPALTLDYTAKHLSELSPTDDDQEVHNDITVNRAGGSSFRATQTAGPLNVSPAPAGVGRYEESLTVNPQTDPQLRHLAGWRLHLGTWDEPRYPAVGVDLARAPYVASAGLAGAVMDTDVADVLAVVNTPAWLPPGGTQQLVRGYTETFSNFEHTVTFVGDPAGPYQVASYGDATAGSTTARYSSNGSTLAAAVAAGATALSVATPTGPLWTTAAGQFPFDIIVAGEQMTVTAVSGTTSPQTFTVARAVNGISKAQASGAMVDLFTPAYYAI